MATSSHHRLLLQVSILLGLLALSAFTVWKKNTPLLYDLIVSHSLEWPSLTVHWLPSPPLPVFTDGLFAVHKLILGTHTSDDFPNFLMVADAHLPLNPATAPVTDPDHDSAIPKV
ncbi:hypothetical protein CsSME_00042228 [Camellia sinensis var. sinensis]